MSNNVETKKRALIHPLWTHLPAITALLIVIGYLIFSSPLPAQAPVHFGFNGVADAYGSPWTLVSATLGISLFFIGLSIFMDDLWAKQEKKKSFNWFSLMDEIIVSWIMGMSLGYLVALHNNADVFSFPWIYGIEMLGGGIVLAVVLESFRPYRQFKGKIEAAETPEFKVEIAQQLKEDVQFVYWENQNPFYVTLLSTVVPLIFVASAIIVWFSEGWTLFTSLFGVFMIFIGVVLPAFTFSGQRILVTRLELTVRWGALGLKVLRLNTEEIAGIELMEFSPLRDFGGYGIRYGRGMSAYYLRGNLGVKITMVNGKKYLVGSDHPERLLAVLELVTGRK
jgi:hypothetical protein